MDECWSVEVPVDILPSYATCAGCFANGTLEKSVRVFDSNSGYLDTFGCCSCLEIVGLGDFDRSDLLTGSALIEPFGCCSSVVAVVGIGSMGWAVFELKAGFEVVVVVAAVAVVIAFFSPIQKK